MKILFSLKTFKTKYQLAAVTLSFLSSIMLFTTTAHSQELLRPYIERAEQEETSTSISCTNGTSKQGCLDKFKKRLVIANVFQENYDPRAYRLLTISLAYQKIVTTVPELQNNSTLRDEYLINMLNSERDLLLESATIDTKALGDYALKILDKTVSETLSVVSDYTKGPWSISDNVYEVAREVVTEFPKIALASSEDLRNDAELKRQAFELTVQITDNKNLYNSTNPEVQRTFDVAFGTIFKHPTEFTDEDIASDPFAQTLDGIDNLLDYQSNTLSIRIDDATNTILGAVETSNIAVQDLIKDRYKKLSANQDSILNGQSAIIGNQGTIITGVGYLTASQMKQERLEWITTASSSDLESFKEKASACNQNSSSEAQSDLLSKQSCMIDQSLVEKAESLILEKKYTEFSALSSQTVGVVSNLGILFKDKNLVKVAADANDVLSAVDHGVKAIKAFNQLSSAVGTVASMASFMTGVGAITNAMSVFSGGFGGSGPDPAIMNKLNEIIDMIEDLKREMSAKLDDLSSKIDTLSAQNNNANLQQNQLLTANIASVAQSVAENTELTNEFIEKLHIVNSNVIEIPRSIKEDNLKRSKMIFESSTRQEFAKEALGDLIIEFDIYTEQFSNFKNPIFESLYSFNNSFNNYSNIINSAALGRSSTKSKYLLLSLINSLQSSDSSSCQAETLKYLQGINVGLEIFSEGLKANFNTNRHPVLPWALSEDINAGFLLQYLEQSIDTIEEVKAASEVCLGLDENLKSDIVSKLFEAYKTQLDSYLEEVNSLMNNNNGLIRRQILANVKTDSGFMSDYKPVFDGLYPEKHTYNDSIAFAVDHVNQFNNPEELSKLASESFKNKDFPNINFCKTGARENLFPFTSLPFPNAFFNKAIKNDYLKLALTSEFINWEVCFEIEGYNEETQTYDFLLKAEEDYLVYSNSLRTEPEVKKQVVGIWPMNAVINEDLKERAENAFQVETVEGEYMFFTRYINGSYDLTDSFSDEDIKHLPKTLTYDNSCQPQKIILSQKVSGSLGDDSGATLSPPGVHSRPPLERFSNLEVYGIRKIKAVKCLSNNGVAATLFERNFVSGDADGWSETKKHNAFCEDMQGGAITRCIDEEFTELEPLAFNEATYEKIKNNTSEENKSLSNFIKYSKKNPEGLSEQKNTIIEEGMKKAYLEFSSRYNSCYFDILKGEPTCSAEGLNNESDLINTSASKNKFHNLVYMAQLLRHLPNLYFTPETDQELGYTETEQLMEMNINEWLSLDELIAVAQNLSNSPHVSMGQEEFMKKVVDENLTFYSEKIEALLMSNFKFDENLLINNSNLMRVKALKETLKDIHNEDLYQLR